MSLLAALTQWLNAKVQKYHHWGIVVAVIGIGLTFCQVRIDRDVREAILFATASERLAAARALDRARTRRGAPPQNNVGQIRVLEEMTALGISMARMDASATYLGMAQLTRADLSGVIFEGADLGVANLSGANLRFARFRDADLAFVDLAGANLASADFTDALLHCADLSGVNFREQEFAANFTDAVLINANLSVSDLSEVVGLTQPQLDKACGEAVKLPDGRSITPCSAAVQGRCEEARVGAARRLGQ